eukprot:10024289-Alexandrium_andersonii.AAC.1
MPVAKSTSSAASVASFQLIRRGVLGEVVVRPAALQLPLQRRQQTPVTGPHGRAEPQCPGEWQRKAREGIR